MTLTKVEIKSGTSKILCEKLANADRCDKHQRGA
jgi:hypothetical protein